MSEAQATKELREAAMAPTRGADAGFLWRIVTPFSTSTTVDWIPGEIRSERHAFEMVPAFYDHDRSRKRTGGGQWLDYLRHAFRAWRFGKGSSVGYVASFPQLALCLGLIKRLSLSRAPIIAWCFNLGRTYEGLAGVGARFALRSVDQFVVHSRGEIDLYAAWLKLPRERFVFAPLSIEISERDDPAVAQAPYILAMGTANRDYKTLLAALAPLRYPTVIVAGAHALEDLDIPDFVSVKRDLPIEECHRLSRLATINVIPLKNTQAPSGQVTLLETMSYGKAVIVTDAFGSRDYVTHGANGLVVPPGDALVLREALTRLWTDQELRDALGRAGRSHVRETSTFAAVAPQMARLLDLAATRAKSGTPVGKE